MQKTLKRLFVLLLSAAIMACIAIFAACDKGNKDGDESEEGKITITVCFPDGTPVNGHTDGTSWDTGINGEDDGTCIKLQFCKEGADGECGIPMLVGEDGKIKLDIQQDIVGKFSAVSDDEEIEVHVLGVDDRTGDKYLKGEGGIYGKFKKNEFPPTLTIKLQAVPAA